MFEAISFAGGGLRCYWQSAVWSVFKAHHLPLPRFCVSVSAGSYHAALAMAGLTDTVLARAVQWYGEGHNQNPQWRNFLKGQSPFVVGALFRDFLADVFDASALARLKTAPPVFMQMALPPRFVPASLSALTAIAAYQIEKMVKGPAHSTAGQYIGFRPAWVSTHDMQSPAELVDTIMASCSVPPFMPLGRFDGRPALDGGLYDNPPLEKLKTVPGQTLVLATRFGPQIEETAQRHVLAPSQPILIGKFTCHDVELLNTTIALGKADAQAFIKRLGLH